MTFKGRPTNPTPIPPPLLVYHILSHYLPGLIIPGTGATQLDAILMDHCPLQLFKTAYPKCTHPASSIPFHNKALAPFSLGLLINPSAFQCALLPGCGMTITLMNCD